MPDKPKPDAEPAKPKQNPYGDKAVFEDVTQAFIEGRWNPVEGWVQTPPEKPGTSAGIVIVGGIGPRASKTETKPDDKDAPKA